MQTPERGPCVQCFIDLYTHTHTHTHNLTGSPQSERPCFNFQMGTLKFSGVKESKVPSEVRADVL